mmetsp:Transcript_4190/g.13358  ORF Transcript_4190/g.13358 Transcript_4190/m.13358 type:complete len:207 (-) Transcript_4190:923-1543(-)
MPASASSTWPMTLWSAASSSSGLRVSPTRTSGRGGSASSGERAGNRWSSSRNTARPAAERRSSSWRSASSSCCAVAITIAGVTSGSRGGSACAASDSSFSSRSLRRSDHGRSPSSTCGAGNCRPSNSAFAACSTLPRNSASARFATSAGKPRVTSCATLGSCGPSSSSSSSELLSTSSSTIAGTPVGCRGIAEAGDAGTGGSISGT